MNNPPKMKQTIISVIGPSGCGKSQYINPIVKQLRSNGYTVEVPHLLERSLAQSLKNLNSEAQFVILHIGADLSKRSNMRIEFHDKSGPMELIGALHRKSPQSTPAPAIPIDDDMDEPLGKACSINNPDCESCQ
jgi:ABC-type oligopeptide transport system ATPase subunit